MEFPAKSASFLLLLCLVGLPAAAQQEDREGPPETKSSRDGMDARLQPDGLQSNRPQSNRLQSNRLQLNRVRTVTRAEGLSIARVAMNSRQHVRTRNDCSHFVHGLYEKAGFPYPYASSSELYAGVADFRRVASPQPGDLAVWQGHAGIVINPAQHAFLSVLHSGPGVDRYDSKYWRGRGRPRFFRYVEEAPSGRSSGSLRSASLRPAESDLAPDAPEAARDETGSLPKSEEKQLGSAMHFGSPVVHSNRPKPQQVNAAFVEACAEVERNLSGRNLLESNQNVIVFERFSVRKIHLRENENWAEVELDGLVTLAGGKAEARKHSERQRWPLNRREDSNWELTPPQNTLYLPQQGAVRILAHDLAQLTDDRAAASSANQEKAELARTLNTLLEK